MIENFKYPTEAFDRLTGRDLKSVDRVYQALSKMDDVEVIGAGTQMVVLKIDDEKCAAFDFAGIYKRRPLKAKLDLYHQQILNLLHPTLIPKIYASSHIHQEEGKQYPGYTIRQLIEQDYSRTANLHNYRGYPDNSGLFWRLKLPDEVAQKQDDWIKGGIPLKMDDARMKNFVYDREGNFVYLDVLNCNLESSPENEDYLLNRHHRIKRDFLPWWNPYTIKKFLMHKNLNSEKQERIQSLSAKAKHLRLLELSAKGFTIEEDKVILKGLTQTSFKTTCHNLGVKPYAYKMK